MDQTFSTSAYGSSGGWYDSVTAECEQAYNAVADTLGPFVETLAGEKKDVGISPTEYDMTDWVTNSEEQGMSMDTETTSGSDIGGERAANLQVVRMILEQGLCKLWVVLVSHFVVVDGGLFQHQVMLWTV